MSPTTCQHKHCGQPLDVNYARYKFSAVHGAVVPFHTACSYAHPEYDVSKGTGSPFTTITMAGV